MKNLWTAQLVGAVVIAYGLVHVDLLLTVIGTALAYLATKWSRE